VGTEFGDETWPAVGRAVRDQALAEDLHPLHAATGRELWKIEYLQTFRPPEQPGIGKGPNSTPTVDRDRVYMYGLGGMLHCVEVATGKVLWKHDCRAEFWGVKFHEGLGDDAWFPPCGCASSPLVDGNTVVVSVGGPKGGSVTASTGTRARSCGRRWTTAAATPRR